MKLVSVPFLFKNHSYICVFVCACMCVCVFVHSYLASYVCMYDMPTADITVKSSLARSKYHAS